MPVVGLKTTLLTTLVGLMAACAPKIPFEAPNLEGDEAAFTYEGPDEVTVDLLRPREDGPRIFVQVAFPDGEAGLFMVDTGAAVSVLASEFAEARGIETIADAGHVEGLGGRSSYSAAMVPDIRLGEAIVPDVEFAVGVRGMPKRAGMMPLDGILGNNVWQRFVVEIDYPADTLVLHRPGTLKTKLRKASILAYHDNHVYVPLRIHTASDPPQTDEVLIQVDTGAGELILSGQTGRAFQAGFTEGVEPILGLGASEYMPSSMFLRRTRRIPIASMEFGGREITADFDATWMNFEGAAVGPRGMTGLAGHEMMAGHCVFFDYQGHRFALTRSHRKPRKIDGHAVLLQQDIDRYGDDPERFLFRAQMLVGLDRAEEAVEAIERYLGRHPDSSEARVLLANLWRHEGNLEAAWDALAPLEPGDLVDEGEIIAAVNGLVLDGHLERAAEIADNAVVARPEESPAHVARADAMLALERYDEANIELLEGARLLQNPDAHLLRRARVALAEGDRYGAIAKIRRLLDLYPSGGLFLWFYATVLDEHDRATFRHDMTRAMAQLHPVHRPLDFMMAAHQSLGDVDDVAELLDEGIRRDCESGMTEPSRDNCLAWYFALAAARPDHALELIDRALQATGDRSDFLDTKAMVHLSRGELDRAHEAAMAAARLAPDDVYMLWQAERIGDMAKAKRSASATP